MLTKDLELQKQILTSAECRLLMQGLWTTNPYPNPNQPIQYRQLLVLAEMSGSLRGLKTPCHSAWHGSIFQPAISVPNKPILHLYLRSYPDYLRANFSWTRNCKRSPTMAYLLLSLRTVELFPTHRGPMTLPCWTQSTGRPCSSPPCQKVKWLLSLLLRYTLPASFWAMSRTSC